MIWAGVPLVHHIGERITGSGAEEALFVRPRKCMRTTTKITEKDYRAEAFMAAAYHLTSRAVFTVTRP